MELDELAEILSNKKRLEELENKPATPFDPSDGMETLEEAKSYIRFLFTQLQ